MSGWKPEMCWCVIRVFNELIRTFILPIYLFIPRASAFAGLVHAPRQDFEVKVIDKDHPSTAFLPDIWQVKDDECYYHKELNADIHVLLAADMATVEDQGKSKYPGNTFGDTFPLAWYHEFDGGRQWYTSLGHMAEHYSDPVFMKHILGGICWVTGSANL